MAAPRSALSLLACSRAAALIAAFLALPACHRSPSGPSQAERLSADVQTAKRNLEKAGQTAAAAEFLQKSLEAGGSVVTYLQAFLPPPQQGGHRPFYELARPTQPWSIVVSEGPAPREYVIEGYGDDLGRPLVTERVKLGTPPAP